MTALTPYVKDISDGGYTHEDYYQWWVQGANVYQQLISIPIDAVEAVDMRGRYDQLVGRWIDPSNQKAGIRPPDTLSSEVDEREVGNLLSWIKQARTLIYYVDYQEDRGGSGRRHAAPEPTADDGVAESVGEIPGYNRSWHWPWIEGWDDPAKRRQILKTENSSGGFKKMVFTIGIAGVAIWGAKQLFSRKKNPAEELPEEEWYE